MISQIQLTKSSLRYSLIAYRIESIIKKIFILAKKVYRDSKDALSIIPLSISYSNGPNRTQVHTPDHQ